MRTHSADRTSSWRRRAGSRRNKKLRNVGSHASDYPKAWIKVYQCDGSFSHAHPA
jgi:hypothetical protein